MIPDKLDERALRRPEFEEGVPIALSDGQEWHFPRPVMRDFYPALNREGELVLTPGSGFGPGYDALVDAFILATTVNDEHITLVALALDLLKRNYAIEPFHLRYLLRLKRPGDPEEERNGEMWAQIAAVALGRDTSEKHTRDGSAPA
jgi:hypothetical protein